MQKAGTQSEADGREEAEDLALAQNGPIQADGATDEVDITGPASTSTPTVRRSASCALHHMLAM